jgi:hypothetical protein
MTEIVFLVEDAPEGGFIARALGHSIHTEADTYAELRDNVRDAVHCHFEAGDLQAATRCVPDREALVVKNASIVESWSIPYV